MADRKLKPCPFCGFSASLYRTSYEYGEFWTAGCDAGHAESPGMSSPEAAADWWNTRPKPRCQIPPQHQTEGQKGEA